MEYENIDEIVGIVNHYITGEINYEQLTQYFKNEGQPTYIIDRIRDIKNTDEIPIKSKNDHLRKKRTNLWSITEDNRLIAGVIRYGFNNWKTISQFVGNNRTSSQCSQKWRRTINPTISKSTWPVEEDIHLVQLVHQYRDI